MKMLLVTVALATLLMSDALAAQSRGGAGIDPTVCGARPATLMR